MKQELNYIPPTLEYHQLAGESVLASSYFRPPDPFSAPNMMAPPLHKEGPDFSEPWPIDLDLF